jgi:hypothetical protein
VAFGYPADCRVAAHLTYRIRVNGDERRLCSDARRNVCGFASGVPGPYNYNVKLALRSHSRSPLKRYTSFIENVTEGALKVRVPQGRYEDVAVLRDFD